MRTFINKQKISAFENNSFTLAVSTDPFTALDSVDFVFCLCQNFHSTGSITLREKYLYSKFFWSIFSCIRTEYGEIRNISPYSVRMRGNTDQKNSKYGLFSRSTRNSFYETTRIVKKFSIPYDSERKKEKSITCEMPQN